VNLGDAAVMLLGGLVVALVLYDLFQSVVLPRPAVGRIRPTSLLGRPLWLMWRWVGTRVVEGRKRESVLAAYGPLLVLLFLTMWVGLLVIGYGLVLFGLRAQIRPGLDNLGDAFYVSGVSLLTLGYGDIVPVGPAARIVVLIEAANGLGVVALVISLLFTLYNSFQRREVLVIALDALAGAPPSGLQLLETCARLGMPEQLERTFQEWKGWAADVLESHLAYPALNYFRSSHDNEAWINSFGAVMDAAVLVATTVDGAPKGAAYLMLKVGGHLVEDFNWYFRFEHVHSAGVELEEFDAARRRLGAAGYSLRDLEPAWEDFSVRRSVYAGPVSSFADFLSITPAPWIGDRRYLPHSDRRRSAHVDAGQSTPAARRDA
jgi:hypothetical protein